MSFHPCEVALDSRTTCARKFLDQRSREWRPFSKRGAQNGRRPAGRCGHDNLRPLALDFCIVEVPHCGQARVFHPVALSGQSFGGVAARA